MPGFRTALDSVQDRSKPFVGAMVLELLHAKFKDRWIVELLFDDLLMWTDWIRDKRIEEPAGLGRTTHLLSPVELVCNRPCVADLVGD